MEEGDLLPLLVDRLKVLNEVNNNRVAMSKRTWEGLKQTYPDKVPVTLDNTPDPYTQPVMVTMSSLLATMERAQHFLEFSIKDKEKMHGDLKSAFEAFKTAQATLMAEKDRQIEELTEANKRYKVDGTELDKAKGRAKQLEDALIQMVRIKEQLEQERAVIGAELASAFQRRLEAIRTNSMTELNRVALNLFEACPNNATVADAIETVRLIICRHAI